MTSLAISLASVWNMSAQNTEVKGRVTDTAGEPLVAVTVYESGNTSNGTVTDIDGNYTISVPPTATLIFSCLGFEEVQEVVAKRNTINVTLAEEQLSIDAAEVVSIGYGTVSRRDLTGSVSKVDMGEIMKAPVTTFDQALTGRVAGVVVSTSDGALGTEANITIRGNNSLTQSSAPLYIIDGFPSESSMATSLNSADIESIDILKDASATAIYGARGANGVIVITTKQGVEGKPKINFSASWTGNKIANKVDLMDGYEFVEFQTDRYAVYGGTNPYLDGYTLEDYRTADWVDWQDDVYRPALTQNYNISLSGGSKEMGNRYNVSFSALDQDGIIVKSNFQRYQGKINFIQKIGKKIELNVLANYSRAVTNGVTPTDAQQSSSASGWLIYSLWGYRPVKPLKNGSILDDSDELIDADIASADDYRFNPAKTVRNEYRKTIVDYLNANASLSWTIIDDLVLKVSGGYTMNKRRREEFNGSQTYTGYAGSPSGKGINGAIYWTDQTTWLNENTLTWTKHIRRNHHLNLLAGVTFQGQNMDYKGVRAEQLSTEALGLNGLNTGQYQNVTPYERNWTLMSGLFRLNYNYKYKYYLTASFRADGSSKFPADNRWGYFPSAGLSWNFNREEALKNSSWLKNGKLRLSWGLTGNNRTSTPYDYYSQITTLPGDPNSYDYVFNGQHVSGYFPDNMANQKLRWETTEQWNVGIDLSFFRERINITADIYRKVTRDLLLDASLPLSSGFYSATRNIGKVKNDGLELSLSTVNIKTKNFQWTTDFNIAFNRNEVLELAENQKSLLTSASFDKDYNSQPSYIARVGYPMGMMYGYIYEGTYKYEDFNQSGSSYTLKSNVPHYTSENNTQPGMPKYKDLNGDGIVDSNDRTIIGRGLPIHTGGFTNNFTYRGFDLSIFFQWSYGNDILNANRLFFESSNNKARELNQYASYADRWTPENPDSDIPVASTSSSNKVFSSRIIEDGSFLRLKTLTLGYTFPKAMIAKAGLSNVRIYLAGQNLWTLTSYSGYDPEVSVRNSALTPGLDYSSYPRTYTISFGVNLGF